MASKIFNSVFKRTFSAKTKPKESVDDLFAQMTADMGKIAESKVLGSAAHVA